MKKKPDYEALLAIAIELEQSIRSANYRYIVDRGQLTTHMQIAIDNLHAWRLAHGR